MILSILILLIPIVSAIEMNLNCISMNYKVDTKKQYSLSEVKTMCNQAHQFYKENSWGKFIFDTDSYICDCPLNGNKGNVYKCEKICINEYNKKHPGRSKNSKYAIVNRYNTFSNAGKNIAHINRINPYRTVFHELSHSLGLHHSGAYNGNKYEEYGDKLSVMGKFPSNYFASPQYKFLGFIEDKQIENYLDNKQFYNLTRLVSNDKENIKIIIVKLSGRDMYISFPQACDKCIALHLSEDGSGTALVNKFSNKYYDKYSNKTYEIIGITNNILNLSIK